MTKEGQGSGSGGEAGGGQRKGWVRRLYDWVLHWAETPSGPSALAVLSAAEASFFPIPPDPLLMALCLGAVKRDTHLKTLRVEGNPKAQLPFVFDDDDRRGTAVDSTISGGCIISGSHLKKTLLFSNVRVHSYSTIEETVILPEVIINRHCKIRRTIIDRGCEVPEGTVIGYDTEQDKANGFRITEKGVVLVTRGMLGQPGGYA